jgi:hypothetical protein
MNMNDLEKMDAIRERMNVTYTQAKEALDQCEGDIVGALVYLEKQGFPGTGGFDEEAEGDEKEPKWDKEKADNFIRGLAEQVKSIIREGNVTKVRLISGKKVLIEIPATLGVLGIGVMLFSPLLAVVTAVGAATALVKEMVFEVEKADGTVERHNLKFPSFGSKEECCCGDEECCCDDEECCAGEGEDAGKETVPGEDTVPGAEE